MPLPPMTAGTFATAAVRLFAVPKPLVAQLAKTAAKVATFASLVVVPLKVVSKAFVALSVVVAGLTALVVALGAAFAGVTLGLTAFIGKKLIDFAQLSAMAQEVENLFRVSFGNMAAEAEKFAQQYADALDLDPIQVKNAAANFNLILKNFGIGERSAAAMALSLTEIAADVSSIANVSFERSFLALKSAMTGEIEPLRRLLGTNISERAVQQLAKDMGVLAEKGTKLTDAGRAMFRYLLITKNLQFAMGDLLATLGSTENRQRRVLNLWTRLKRSIGDQVIPVWNEFLALVIKYLKHADKMVKQNWDKWMGALKQAINTGLDKFADFVLKLEDVRDWMLEAIETGKEWAKTLWDIAKAAGEAAKKTVEFADKIAPSLDKLEGHKALHEAHGKALKSFFDIPGMKPGPGLFAGLREIEKREAQKLVADAKTIGSKIGAAYHPFKFFQDTEKEAKKQKIKDAILSPFKKLREAMRQAEAEHGASLLKEQQDIARAMMRNRQNMYRALAMLYAGDSKAFIEAEERKRKSFIGFMSFRDVARTAQLAAVGGRDRDLEGAPSWQGRDELMRLLHDNNDELRQNTEGLQEVTKQLDPRLLAQGYVQARGMAQGGFGGAPIFA